MRIVLAATNSVMIAVVINLCIVLFDFGETELPVVYPGPINSAIYTIVPFVWLVLFGAMGTSIALLSSKSTRERGGATPAIVLLANCGLYPIYTLGFSSMDLGLAGNILTAVLAAYAVGIAWPISRTAAVLMAPVAAWVLIASVGLVATMTGRTF
jgi:tryptophan-rich sensory protein